MSDGKKEFSLGTNNNQAIKASAGTGKTFRLAMRFISLLFLYRDLEPEQIVAITFTRKAAAEILDKIIGQLLELNKNPKDLEKLKAGGLLPPAFTPADIPGILKRLLTARELQISTIDSFLVKIIQAYAPEFGLSGTVEMIDESRDRGVKDTIAELIRQDQQGKRILASLLRDYAQGKDARNFTSTLESFLRDNYEIYLLYPDQALWGNLPDAEGLLSQDELERIIAFLNVAVVRYNEMSEAGRCAVTQISAVLDAANTGKLDEIKNPLQTTLGPDGVLYIKREDSTAQRESEPVTPELLDLLVNDSERKKVLKTLDRLRKNYKALLDSEKKLRKFIEAANSGKPGDITSVPAKLTPYEPETGPIPEKCAPISQEMVCALDKLSRHIAVLNLRQKKAKTQAAYQILKRYDAIYAANVRSVGRLAFRDIPKILGELDPETELDLEYRLDTRNRHYMLDEFQDTSTRQWAFMSNLISEAISGPEQSFFMVGDLKQSLYQWRFGNPKLFDAIGTHYNMDPETLEDSRRSEPEIIAAVNDVFDAPNRQKIESDAVREAIERLQFKEHRAVKKDYGYVRLQQFSKTEDKDERAAKRAEEILKIVREAKPLERHRSVAILLRTNDEIGRYKQCLRDLDQNLPISTEGAIQPQDSMACTFLTQLLRLAAHPADQMARRVLPLFSWSEGDPLTAAEIVEDLQLPGSADWDALSQNLRILLQEAGIRGVVSRFQTAYELKLSEFDRDCLSIAATQAIDFTGSVDEYLASLKKAKGAGVSIKNTVQIMTIHKSKGLEFAMVFLPELDAYGGGGENLEIAPMNENRPQSYGSEGGDSLKPDFISYLPVDFARKFLPDEFEQNHQKIEADKLYEKVCGLYVAMTRAERALYMFVAENTGKTGSSFRADQLLVQTLAGDPDENGVLYSRGMADWYNCKTKDEEEKEKQKQKPPREITLTALSVKRPDIQVWHSPSQHRAQDEEENTSVIRPEYRFEVNPAAELGTRVHAMFEAIEYLDSVKEDDILGIAGNDELARQALELWHAATAPGGEIAQALTRPEGVVELWRERDFLLQNVEGELISGSFDRVEIHRDATNAVTRVVIYDYKSDQLTTPGDFLERHQEQLNAYREACSQMLKLPTEKIECVILALRLNKVIPVPRK